MFDNYYAVIMAGGGGTRLWPLSRQSNPKQMLRLIGDRSLYRIAVDRLVGKFPADRIFVVTVADQASDLQEQTPEIPEENFILEPQPKGTASVVGLAGIVLRERDPRAVMAVLTADHFIGNEEKFSRLLKAAYLVARDGFLVTLGITPTSPATGYGYIQRGELIGQYQGLNVYHALRFKEKPDEIRAKEMLVGGDHAWNSGMFVWQVSQILEEFARQMPDLSARLEVIAKAWSTADQQQVLALEWEKIEAETIDFGIMEGAREVAVIPAEGLDWSDVGSWDSLFEVLETDPEGNIVMGGKHVGMETRNSLIYTQQQQRLIVTIGVNDLVVVDTGDVILICHKDESQKVREIVDRLSKTDDKFL